MAKSDTAQDDAEAARKAAWVIYTEMRTRVTTVRMRYRDGDDKAALESVHTLFKTVRKVLQESGPGAGAVAAKAIEMLNGAIRPFTGKWHHRSVAGRLVNHDDRRAFRRELRLLQDTLESYESYFLAAAEDSVQEPESQLDSDSENAHAKHDGETQATGQEQADSMGEPSRGTSRTCRFPLGHVPPATDIPVKSLRRRDADPSDGKESSTLGVDFPTVLKDESTAIQQRREWAYGESSTDNLCGLCLSGGGIRSATFALGVLHSLGARGVLRHVDYLSTVSGGGYLGGYLISQLRRGPLATAKDQKPEDKPSLAALDDARLFDEAQWGNQPGSENPPRRLRNKSSALSKDSIGALLLWARGYALNLGVIGSVAGLLAFMLWVIAIEIGSIDRLYLAPAPWPYPDLVKNGIQKFGRFALLLSGLSIALIVVAWFAALISSTGRMWLKTWRTDWYLMIVAASALGAYLVSSYWTWTLADSAGHMVLRHAIILLAVNVVFALLTLRIVSPGKRRMAAFLFILSPLAKGIIGTQIVMLMFAILQLRTEFWYPFLLAAVFAYFLFSAHGFNINHISLAAYYRRHIEKSYLHAYRYPESAQESKVEPHARLGAKNKEKVQEPYHLINATLNLPTSENDSLHGRQGDIFLFSRLYSGSRVLGYFDNAKSFFGGLSYSDCIAISGAAASPLMGHLTRPSLSAWFAALNIRLAHWLPNPRTHSEYVDPPSTLLWEELRADANESSEFINLSDGGHSENLGIYELLSRRCQTVICVDGEADPDMRFDGMIRLIRLAKVDFDIDIEIELEDIRHQSARCSYSHFALGKIRYPEPDRAEPGAEMSLGGSTGYLLYIKSSLTGNEAELISDYVRDNPDFPHEPTSDQLFSEAQFEAYRALGQHVGEDLFADLFDVGWAEDLSEDLGVPLGQIPERLRDKSNPELSFHGSQDDNRAALQWFFARLVQTLNPDALPGKRDSAETE